MVDGQGAARGEKRCTCSHMKAWKARQARNSHRNKTLLGGMSPSTGRRRRVRCRLKLLLCSVFMPTATTLAMTWAVPNTDPATPRLFCSVGFR